MEMVNFTNASICRCCATEGIFKDIRFKYQWMGEDEIYGDMLKECFDINLHSVEGTGNGGICEVCITQLRSASNFKRQVLNTEELFKKCLQDKKLSKDDLVKIEDTEEDNVELDHGVSEDFSGEEFEMPIKEEEEPKPKKRGAKKIVKPSKKSRLDDGESSSKGKSQRLCHLTAEHSDVDAPAHSDNSKKKKNQKANVVFKNNELTTQNENKEIEIREIVKHKINARMILLYTNATPIRCQVGKGYGCIFCNEHFHMPSDLKKHTQDNHQKAFAKFASERRMSMFSFLVKMDITDLKCNICSSEIETIENMLKHLLTVHKQHVYTDIKSHMFPFKFYNDELKCVYCSSTFSRFKMLLQHMNTHFRNYLCNSCEAGFVNKEILSHHASDHKTGIFQCSYCEKTFVTHKKRRTHERDIHKYAGFIHKCSYCDERFSNYDSRNKHMADIHGVFYKDLNCNACERTFKTTRCLTKHISRQHLMRKHFECKDCDMSFYTSADLKNHTVKHTGKKEFICDLCKKEYGRKKSLREHMRIHADDRRFTCPYCDLAFIQKCSLKGHVKSKHGKLYLN